MIVSSTDPSHRMPFPYNAETNTVFNQGMKPIQTDKIKDPMGYMCQETFVEGCQPLKPLRGEIVIINRKNSENGQKLNFMA